MVTLSAGQGATNGASMLQGMDAQTIEILGRNLQVWSWCPSK